ncbi:MAG: hypothetical protein KJO31_07290 [Gammaproteobacteria bacterium]|nr:hypothetical protein [Gammaproteobacteria bacterium]
MTIQDWGAIGEIVGAIAVVVSLIYLAIQIRQNTHQIALSMESSKLAAFERNVESGNRAREILVGDAALADLFLKGAADFANLDPTDRFRCDMLFRILFSSLQGGYVRVLTVGGDVSTFSGPKSSVDALVRSPGIRQWLECTEPDWRPEFSQLVRERAAFFADRASSKNEQANAD